MTFSGGYMRQSPGYSTESDKGAARDMDTLRASILAAKAGTGEVERVLRRAHFVPRHNAFTSLLQLASRAREPEKALEIFSAMQTVAGIQPNTFSYSALISALARAGQWQQAEHYFNELQERSATDESCRPNTVTYSALISAYAKGRQLEKALETFQQQLYHGVEPDLITFSSLIGGCERAGDIGTAVSLLDRMHALGLAGPQQMYHGVLAACGSRWEAALETFLGMQCAGVGSSAQSASLLMASLCAGGQRDHALCLLSEAKRAGWALAHTSLAALLLLLAEQGDWRAADAVLAHMRATGVHVDSAVARSVVEAHARGGDVGGAELATQQFERMGLQLRQGKGDEAASGGAVKPSALVMDPPPPPTNGESVREQV